MIKYDTTNNIQGHYLTNAETGVNSTVTFQSFTITSVSLGGVISKTSNVSLANFRIFTNMNFQLNYTWTYNFAFEEPCKL